MILLEKSNSAVRDFLWGWMDGKKKGREQVKFGSVPQNYSTNFKKKVFLRFDRFDRFYFLALLRMA